MLIADWTELLYHASSVARPHAVEQVRTRRRASIAALTHCSTNPVRSKVRLYIARSSPKPEPIGSTAPTHAHTVDSYVVGTKANADATDLAEFCADYHLNVVKKIETPIPWDG